MAWGLRYYPPISLSSSTRVPHWYLPGSFLLPVALNRAFVIESDYRFHSMCPQERLSYWKDRLNDYLVLLINRAVKSL